MNIDHIDFINTMLHEATKYIKNIAFSYWSYFFFYLLEWKIEHCMYKWNIP